MNVHVLQHVPFEDIGSIKPWLLARGAGIGYTRFFDSCALPDPTGLDLVIAMGGPMSVHDEVEWPWLAPEKEFLRTAIRRGVAVLGVCLGAQLIASALGARVWRAAEREIGWFDVEAVSGSRDAFRFPPRVTVFHWHGETFELPAGAVHLARSAACEHQAFQVGENVIGLQFHLETTPEAVDALIAHCRKELVEGRFVQPEAGLRAAPAAVYRQMHALLEGLLGYLTGGKGRSVG